jgi:hypothetical protein
MSQHLNLRWPHGPWTISFWIAISHLFKNTIFENIVQQSEGGDIPLDQAEGNSPPWNSDNCLFCKTLDKMDTSPDELKYLQNISI